MVTCRDDGAYERLFTTSSDLLDRTLVHWTLLAAVQNLQKPFSFASIIHACVVQSLDLSLCGIASNQRSDIRAWPWGGIRVARGVEPRAIAVYMLKAGFPAAY